LVQVQVLAVHALLLKVYPVTQAEQCASPSFGQLAFTEPVPLLHVHCFSRHFLVAVIRWYPAVPSQEAQICALWKVQSALVAATPMAVGVEAPSSHVHTFAAHDLSEDWKWNPVLQPRGSQFAPDVVHLYPVAGFPLLHVQVLATQVLSLVCRV
jgi:hypothetical protein